MISRIFLPRTGHFDWVSGDDMIFMRHMIEGKALNLPSMMLAQMHDAAQKARACLTYGMAFTLLFSDSGVDLEGENNRLLHHTDTYLVKSLQRMGYHQVEGVWTKKVSGQRVVHQSSDEDEEVEHHIADTETTQEESDDNSSSGSSDSDGDSSDEEFHG